MFGKQDKMDVRCSSETEANRVSKNGHKEGKESKGSEGNISTSFLKDQQGTFSASAATEDCNKSKSSSADPDYCRRILVRDAKGSIREIILPKGLDLDRPKRTRTSFTAEQLYRLEMEFQRCQYVVGRERTELARQLNLSETQVKVWFQNRRTKQKKDQGKDSELRSVVSETAATCSVLRLLEQGRYLQSIFLFDPPAVISDGNIASVRIRPEYKPLPDTWRYGQCKKTGSQDSSAELPQPG
ncbi:unnamed protein product [Bubo scandiacus]